MDTHAKGMVSMLATVGAGVTAWIPMIETALRLGVSVVGIVAGIYTIRYWRKASTKLDTKVPYRNENE